jgi:uracil-DNA glycosylase
MLNQSLRCDLPCTDVNRDFIYPRAQIDPAGIQLVMISEAPLAARSDYFYEGEGGSFFRTTRTAFSDAGVEVSAYQDLTEMGIYLTTAIKCSKKGYLVCSATIEECSRLLEKEIDQFPNVKVIMCMGDVAIKAVNSVARRRFGKRVIPPGSTYKIRQGIHELNNTTYFPSYTQTGASFDIEKSKRRMIAEDIRKALSIIR